MVNNVNNDSLFLLTSRAPCRNQDKPKIDICDSQYSSSTVFNEILIWFPIYLSFMGYMSDIDQ